ncbi:glycosyltransferase [Sphaerisporangium sp. B11E5]|uniref:glycosyltransferase family 2 protein n=1 Tax=Sphaerisporangium sp. B11E5 TaxID=3153563 RepID=UPI00325E09D9
MNGISVVIPVKGRVPQTRALLESLRVAAGRSPVPSEVLVVDDSVPAEASLHQENCRFHDARYVPGPRHVGAKRNLGVELAKYDHILFTDSDCRVAPDLLERYAAAMPSLPDDVAAITGPTMVEEGDTAVFRIMKRSTLLNTDHERPLVHSRLSWAATSNVIIRKSAFQQVGGFPSDSLTVVCGEDIDLGIRLTEAGYAIICDAGAIVTHDSGSTDSLRTVCARLFMYGQSEQWLCVMHPGRRRLVLNAATLVAAVGLLSLPAARRSRGRSLLAAPVVAGAVLASRAWRRRGGDRTPRAALDSVACAFVDSLFDVGAFTAAFQLRRPELLFMGFTPTEDVK